jgi:histidyl-tRNA synthetase
MEENMALSTQPYKGARDFYPEEKNIQQYMFDIWRRVCESYGYELYDAPILEPTELYLAKGNQEIIDEQTYTFEDRGKRMVTVRTEMTPSVSRMVAGKRQELAYPVRWFSIPNLWRYERPQGGRLREFWQLNVDLFGVQNTAAELEMLQIVDACFKEFGAKRNTYTISINHRELIDFIIDDYLKIDSASKKQIVGLIDRMKKMDRTTFIGKVDSLLSPAQKAAGATEKLLAILDTQKLKDLPPEVQKTSAYKELEVLLARLKQLGISNAQFDGTLMRGFDYYTGIVFEAFDTDPDNNRSLLGGGRYDGLVGQFGVQPVPTVGFAWGDVTLEKFLRAHRLLPELGGSVEVRVLLAGDMLDQAQPLIQQLRDAGYRVAVDFSGRKLNDQLKAANKAGVPFVAVIGEDELKDDVVSFKDMRSGMSYRNAPAFLAEDMEARASD